MRISPWNVTLMCGFLITVFVGWGFFHISANMKHDEARSIKYDAVWSSTNGRNEFYKFSASVSRYLLGGEDVDREDALVKFDIVMSRMDTWSSGSFNAFLTEKPIIANHFEQLLLTLNKLDALMHDLNQGQAEAIQELIRLAKIDIEHIANKAYQSSIVRFDAERTDFQDSLQTEKYIVSGLLVFATCLLGVVMVQNWNLTNANVRIAGTAEQLQHLAKHDPLTTLPNRTLVEDHLAMARKRMTWNDALLAIALDLDGFKAINDTLGHAGGDALLVAVSDRLTEFVRSLPGHNIVARVGGDEFLLIIFCRAPDLDVESISDELLAMFKNPFETSIGSLLAGASIGYAITNDVRSVDTVMLNADLALIEAKATLRGSSRAYEPSMRTQFQRRLRIERELPLAIKTGGILPHYQPQYDISSNELVGIEALARWERGTLDSVAPDEFIQVAEASGDILELGKQILMSACRDVQVLPPNTSVAVNLSMVQLLNDDVVQVVTSALEKTGLEPRRLKLEVTESVVMKNVEAVTEILARLQALGVAISLDDFGTGYSSLSYLSNFKWDELKIDRSFVAACESSSKDLNIINVIKSLAEKINASLMIEGLETRGQVDLFRKLGCSFGQGFFYAKPMALDKLRAHVASEQMLAVPKAAALRS